MVRLHRNEDGPRHTKAMGVKPTAPHPQTGHLGLGLLGIRAIGFYGVGFMFKG